MQTVEILKAARALITPPEAWAQRHCAYTADDEWVPITDPRACKFCSMGAIYKVNPNPGEETPEILEALKLLNHFETPIGIFNDTHTHAEVLALFDKAIAA